MIAKWLAHNKNTDTDEYIEVPLLDGISISVNMASFQVSNITVIYDDFLDYELPFAWQEIQLLNDNEETEYIFYFKSLTAPKFSTNNETIKLQMSLYSTRDLLAHRTRTVQTSGALNTVIATIINEIIDDDGYTIVENTLPTTTVTATFIKQTLENILNTMATNYEFVWYCDGLKNIYLKPFSTLTLATPDLLIDSTLYTNYGYQIQPTIATNDYGNVVELKNIMLVDDMNVYEPDTDTTLGAGESITFSRKVWATLEAKNKNPLVLTAILSCNSFVIHLDDNGIPDVNSELVGYDDIGGDYNWLLIRDPDNNNLWTGLKNNMDIDQDIGTIYATTALIPTSYTYYDVKEINNISTYTNTSGKIQKSIDMYNKYMGIDEMLATAKGNLIKANSIANTVTITMEVLDKTKDYPNIKIADVIKINVGGKLGNLIGEQTYVVTDYTRLEGIKRLTYTIKASNINYNYTYIDLFRKVTIQDNDEQLTNQVSIYETETINEITTVKVDGVDVYEN